MKPKNKRLLSLLVSTVILVFIYIRIDFHRLLALLYHCDIGMLLLGLMMVIPITLMTAWRLQRLAPQRAGIGFGESNRLILAASTLNMVLPSKMGDVAKAYFIRDQGRVSGSLSLSLVVFEKACDMLSLLLWCALGLILYPGKDLLFWVMTSIIAVGLVSGALLLGSRTCSRLFFYLLRLLPVAMLRKKVALLEAGWAEMYTYFWSDTRRLVVIVAVSVCTWFLHLLQIWFFIIALKASVPLLVNLALTPLAILAGLLPLTFAGIGTRDAALIFFYANYMDGATAAALGLLCTSRYFLPALAGLPFLNRYLVSLRGQSVAPEAGGVDYSRGQ